MHVRGAEDEERSDDTYDRKESAVNAAEALFPHDGHRPVHEAAKTRLWALGVVD